MILKWIRWKLFIRIRRKYSNLRIKFFDNNKKFIFLSGIIFKLFELITTYFINYYYVYEVIKNNIYTNLVLLFIIISSFWDGILTANNYLISIDKEWLKTNLLKNDSKVKLLVFFENLLYKSWNMIIIIFEIIFPARYKFGDSIIKSFLICMLLMVIYAVNALLVAYINDLYTHVKNKIINPYFRIGISAVLKSIIFYATYIITGDLYKYLNNVFLMINKNDIKYLDSIKNDFGNTFGSFVSILKSNWFNYKYILYYCVYFSILIIFIKVSTSALRKYDIYYLGESKYLNTIERFFNRLYDIKIIKDKIFIIYVKVFLRNFFTLKNISAITGSVGYWIDISFICSLIVNSDNEILRYAVITTLISMPVYKVGNYIFEKLYPSLALESDGKKVYIQLLSKQVLWNILNRKMKLFMCIFVPVIFCSDIVVFFVTRMNLINILIIFVIHIFMMIFYTHVYYIPGAVAPHFNFIDIQQLYLYKDKEVISETINIFIHVFLNPIIILPVVFFVTNIMNIRLFIVIQIIVPIILCVGLTFIIRRYLKRKLSIKKILSLDL